MSLPAYEASRAKGEPVNLYLFKYGAGSKQYFAYTDAESFVPFGTDADGDVVSYAPIAIDRGKITASGSLDKSNVTVTTPHDTDLANLFLIYPPSSVVTLVMRQGHVNDPDQDFRVVWTGRVLACARKGVKAEFTCEPIATSMRRNGLRRRYQFGCPLVLYGTGEDACNADKAAATRTTTVSATSGSRVTLPAGWYGSRDPAKFLQGIAEWTTAEGSNEVRTILKIENGGLTLMLSGAPRALPVGGTIKIVLGCNHKSGTDAQPDGDCGPLHGNILNFGGQERIPFKNPIGLRNSYY